MNSAFLICFPALYKLPRYHYLYFVVHHCCRMSINFFILNPFYLFDIITDTIFSTISSFIENICDLSSE